MAASADVKCTCRVCTRVRLTIDQIFRVLEIYGWLLNSYVVDFYEENLWDKLPECWRVLLEDTTPREFGKWLSGDILCTHVWPLSLLALRRVSGILQIKRNAQDPKSVLSCEKSKKTEVAVSRAENALHDLNSRYEKVHNLFSRHVKKKKRYEIEEMAQACANCAFECDTRCIVDVGAGMGHLARALAFQYGLFVACIEQDAALLEQARKCDQDFLTVIQKHLPNFSNKSPEHLTAKLESSSLDETKLIDQVQRLLRNSFDLREEEATTFGLLGLHPCGDLAPTLLRLYASRNEAKFICIVGCCYMKLTFNGVQGYPLSRYLTLFETPKPSYAALEVSCHAIEKHCDKLATGNYEDLIVHAYRAALETILIKKNENLRHSQVKSVKAKGGMTFQQYCNAATTHLDSNLQPQNSDMNSAEIERHLNHWQRIIIFGSLRMMLAPLVETIVLLDRFLYLSEQNLSPTLKPLFDPRLSPRNFVLTSMKK